ALHRLQRRAVDVHHPPESIQPGRAAAGGAALRHPGGRGDEPGDGAAAGRAPAAAAGLRHVRRDPGLGAPRPPAARGARRGEAVGAIGRAIATVSLTVRRPDGTEAAIDEVGELVARGSNIMLGYWRDAEETARVLSEHGYHTGDLARRDERGLLYIVGRKKDM